MNCQNRDGGFVYQLSGGGESAFPRSAAAIVALNSAGIYKSPEITRGLDYLTQFRPEQGVTRRVQYYEYGHYYAVQAMWQADGERWARWYPAIRDELIARQRPDGSWRSDLRFRICHGHVPHHLADAREPVADLPAVRNDYGKILRTARILMDHHGRGRSRPVAQSPLAAARGWRAVPGPTDEHRCPGENRLRRGRQATRRGRGRSGFLGTAAELRKGPILVLADGGYLPAAVLGADKAELSVDSARLGPLKLPLDSLAGIVFRLPPHPAELDTLLDRVARGQGQPIA